MLQWVGTLGLLLALVTWPSQASASALQITIEGQVSRGSLPATGQQVAVNCSGPLFANFIGFATSDHNGHYTINTSVDLCPLGSKVEVRGDQDGDGKFESVGLGVAAEHTVVNLQLGTIDVPEYGLIGGVAASAFGAASLLIVRRRTLKSRHVNVC